MKMSMIDFQTQNFQLPPEHLLVSLRGCTKKKFLVGISQHQNLRTFSVVFWVWNNANFLYIFDQHSPLDQIRILDLSTLVIFGESILKVFDSEQIRFVQNIQVEGQVADAHLLPNQQILLKLRNGCFYKINRQNQEIEKIETNQENSKLVYIPSTNSLLNASDIKSLSLVKF